MNFYLLKFVQDNVYRRKKLLNDFKNSTALKSKAPKRVGLRTFLDITLHLLNFSGKLKSL